jgi:hypothetical protein
MMQQAKAWPIHVEILSIVLIKEITSHRPQLMIYGCPRAVPEKRNTARGHGVSGLELTRKVMLEDKPIVRRVEQIVLGDAFRPRRRPFLKNGSFSSLSRASPRTQAEPA